MKKIVAVLIVGLCIGFSVGAFISINVAKSNHNIASSGESFIGQAVLPDMELYLEALKNAKFQPLFFCQIVR